MQCRSNGGRPVAEIRWYESEAKIPIGNEGTKMEIKKSGKQDDIVSTLSLTITKEHNGKKFFCEVTHPALSEPMVVNVTLNVQYPPEVTLAVSPNAINENMKVEFRCTAVGNPNQLTYKWYRNGAAITGPETTKYVITNIGRNYNGDSIDCEVTNSVGSGRGSITMNVRYGPRFSAPPQNVAADVGDDITMTCLVDGNPTPTVIWTRKGSLRVLSTGNSYSITKTQDEDFTPYLCTSTVMGFPEITGEVKLFKKGPPKISSPASLMATQGKTALVECRIESVPPPDSIIWMKNSEVLDVGNMDRYNVEQEVLENGIRSILRIIDVYEGDLGLYNCSAWNSYGSDAKAIALRVEAPLPLHFLLGGIIGGMAVIAIVIVVVIVCLKKRKQTKVKRNDNDDKDDSDLDVKVEYKSNVDPEVDIEWVGEHRDIPNGDLYRYSAEYAEPLYNLPKDMHNNNGYIPYVDYHHDYNPNARDFTTTFGHPNSHSPVYMYRQESTYVPSGSLSDHGSYHSDYSRPPSGRMATHV
nr:Kirrel [Euperipatoides kanangrensis]